MLLRQPKQTNINPTNRAGDSTQLETLSTAGRTTRENISKDTEELNTINQQDLTDSIEHFGQQQQDEHFFFQVPKEHIPR